MKITALKKIYKPKEATFLDYGFEKLAQFIITPRSNNKKEELPAWSPATFDGDKLTNDNVVEISCAVFDVDGGVFWEYHKLFRDYQYIAHTSFSHSNKLHKWRLVIPFEKPVPSHLWNGAWEQSKRFFYDITTSFPDEKCKDPRRFYFVGGGGQIFFYTNPQNRNTSSTKVVLQSGALYEVHVNYGKLFSIDFQRCEKYNERERQEQEERLKKLEQRYEAIQRLPQYLQNPKESLALKLATDSQYREELGRKIGGKSSGGANPRIIGWKCPCCGRNDATYYYINPLGNKTTAQCGHLNSCGQWWNLFQLGRTFGEC